MVTKANGGSLISNSIAEATMVPMRLESLRALPTSTITKLHSRTRLLDELVGLDDVAFLDVVARQGKTTLVAVANLGGIVLLPLQRRDGDRLGHHDVVAEQTRLGVASHDARGDEAAGDVADLGRPEDRPDLGTAELLLLVDRLEHALECG